LAPKALVGSGAALILVAAAMAIALRPGTGGAGDVASTPFASTASGGLSPDATAGLTTATSNSPSLAATSAGPTTKSAAAPGPATNYPPPVAAANGKAWALTFAEEFNGTSYDPNKLTPCFDWNTGGCTSSFNQGREHYQPSQVVVSNGTAKLVAAPLAPPLGATGCQGGTCTYKSGLLSTARPRTSGNYLYSFTYGYVEARLKLPATQGFFTAFWMLPTDPSFNYTNEIDILEALGDDPTTMYMTYAYNNRSDQFPVNTSKGKNGACATKDYSKDFVRMGLDWAPDHIAWYIDGMKCGEFRTAGSVYNGPMQIILNLMVDVKWQRDWNVGLADPTLTRQLEVDYIHVFQQR
jgi:beta-glucanase (GH16 family)